MNNEEILYYCSLLTAGLSDDFIKALDKALIEENPITDLTLSLFDCNGDINKYIQVLNTYLSNITKEQINLDIVFNMICRKFKFLYEQSPNQIETLTLQMSTVAQAYNLDTIEPWKTMAYLCDDYESYIYGGISKKEFMDRFLSLLYR